MIGYFLLKLEFAVFRVVRLVSNVCDALIRAGVEIVDLITFELALDFVGARRLKGELAFGGVGWQNFESSGRQKPLSIGAISLLDGCATGKKKNDQREEEFHEA